MHNLGQKQVLGAYLREKLSSRGFSAKTEALNVIKLKLWGLTRKNVKGWMAGSNSKELRGLGVKVWTKLQLVLN